MAFNVIITTAQVDRIAKALRDVPRKLPQAIAGAINKTLPRVRKGIAQDIQEVMNLKYGRIIKGATITKASQSSLSGSVVFAGRAVGAIQYKHSASKTRGVSVTFTKGGRALNFRHAFKGVGINSNEHIFSRKPGEWYEVGAKAHYKPNVGRRAEKITAIYGPSLQTIYANHPRIFYAANDAARTIIDAELEKQIARFTKGTS